MMGKGWRHCINPWKPCTGRMPIEGRLICPECGLEPWRISKVLIRAETPLEDFLPGTLSTWKRGTWA